jgi:hypothetical protein
MSCYHGDMVLNKSSLVILCILLPLELRYVPYPRYTMVQGGVAKGEAWKTWPMYQGMYSRAREFSYVKNEKPFHLLSFSF